MRDKSVRDGIHADPLPTRRKSECAGKKRAYAPARDPEYGQWHAVKDSEVGPEIPASPQYFDCGKRLSSWVKPARQVLRA